MCDRLSITVVLMLCICLVSAATADDLFRIRIDSEDNARLLRQTAADIVLRTGDGYLALADRAVGEGLRQAGLDVETLAENITRDNLALDILHNRANVGKYPIVYEEDNLRVFLVDRAVMSTEAARFALAPLESTGLPVSYRVPAAYNPGAVAVVDGLDSLIDLVSQDSLTSYTERLQAFFRRFGGTDSSRASSDWLKTKFESFGYDSIVFDSFSFFDSRYGYGQMIGRNVAAVKIGSRHPDWQIIVGAHYDGVVNSPAADDNGSGTAGVLEIARILKDVETDMTFIFIAFDFEEWGLWGSWHYANEAFARGDYIVYMLNMDMIAHFTNDAYANLYYGEQTAFSQLWADLADSLVNITASFRGSSGGSDHFPFTQNGFHSTFVQEGVFSTVYHSSHDSTTYMNFEYMTRMVMASAATVYAANRIPPPVIITSVLDAGDGQSLQLNWIPMDGERIDHIKVYYQEEGAANFDSLVVAGAESQVLITGLTEGVEYLFYALPFNVDGETSVEYFPVTGIPYFYPRIPAGLAAEPAYHGIRLTWMPNTELDFSHYRLVRDNATLPGELADTVYIDADPTLGTGDHTYYVYAVDETGHTSNIYSAPRVTAKAAMLVDGRILAVNRSHRSPGPYLVNEVATGELLRQALVGYDYDYYSDTAYNDETNPNTLDYSDFIDYELVVIGAESAGTDDICRAEEEGGILDDLQDYLAIGGKVILFGRWGDIGFEGVLPYEPGMPEYGYSEAFDIDGRHLMLTEATATDLYSDCIGGSSIMTGYPELVWDSAAAVDHSDPYTGVSGIPCVSYPILSGNDWEVLYTFNSSDDQSAAEGQPVAWRGTDAARQYVSFELPLSFMDRDGACMALSRVVQDFGFSAAATIAVPEAIDVWAETSATVDIYLGNLTWGRTVYDIDQTTVLINDSLIPEAVEILPVYAGFEGPALRLSVSERTFARTLGPIMGDGRDATYSLAWQYTGETISNRATGGVMVNGYRCGDVNMDGITNVGDIVHLINYIFKQGAGWYPDAAGDVNGDETIGVGDAVYYINFVFKSGDPLNCP